MSASRNPEAVSNQEGEFSSRVPRDEPMTTHGHKPGILASERDRAPEFSAQTLPAGTAPASHTFAPNANTETPPLQDYASASNIEPDAERASASDTLGGATSGEVHTGLGHPGQGMTSSELHHEGKAGRKREGAGLEGVGASGALAEGGKVVDARDPAMATSQRALGKEEAEVGRGTIGGPAAEERVPEGAETVAGETKLGR